MDKGAHFYKCDFQVHTPRDINWSGDDAVTPGERKIYAEELIHACRKKGLNAIAITDHHDFVFFPYVRKAAQDELDDTGQPIPENMRVVVFPGIELTLTAPTCQALLILDADFPENLFPSVLAALSISPAPLEGSKHATIQRIPQNVVNDLTHLYQKLNSHQQLNGRFTVFPNVTENGHGTLLRSGFANFYKTMPCVGGYVDGPAQFGTGNSSIISGENREYGFKSIAFFQTSDNRKRNHADLGKHTTWVKWSRPTAEALRQACLAKESRLSQNEPELPNIWINSISVSNSKFLGRVELDLNQQYNAVIGGRGTGKSTILEYLRWSLCDQPAEYYDSDIAPVQSKRKKLIEDTLQKFDGEVNVTFLLNKIKHVVKRSSKTKEILLKIGDAEFLQTTENEIRNLLPIRAYSQKQLSSIGIRIEELKRFVELPVKKTIDQTRSDIHDTATKIRLAYSQLIRKKEIESEINKYKIEITSLAKQIEGLRAGLVGLSEEDQDIINQKAKYDNEEAIFARLKNELGHAHKIVDNLKSEFLINAEEQEAIELQNVDLIQNIQNLFTEKFADISTKILEISELLSEDSLKAINNKITKWETLKTNFDKKYEATKLKAKVDQQQLNQIHDAEKRISELKMLQQDNRNTIGTLGNPEIEYKELREKWDELHTKKINVLDSQCKQFSSLSNGLIKAEITKSLDVDLLKQNFKTALAGMNIKEDKIDTLCRCILGALNPLSTWNDLLVELEKLALYNVSGTAILPATPILNSCSFIENERIRIAINFDSKKWLDLSVVELEFNPVFLYCTNKETNEYINFVDASAGQQATALLTVLLNQQGTPLIIDQPEDDVDNKLIKNIIEQIWKAKSNQQLIFASHNANFVVNGDAELVICCDYIKSGDQTGGQIKNTGAIDNKQIREEITLVTEGGEAAFKLRMEKYGF
jgi:type III restriction enzyme